MGFPGTWRTGRRIILISSTEYVTILFGTEGGGLGDYGCAFWDLHYGEIVWFCLFLDLYLLGDRLGDRRSNGILIRIYWWRPACCCFPCSMWTPLVQEIWSSIAWEFFLSLLIGRLIGWSWDQSGDLDLSRNIDWEIVRATGGLIGWPWQIRVWFGWSRLGLVLWGIFWLLYCPGDREFDREIGSSIDRGFSGILTCWEIACEINQNIVLVTGLVLVASPSGYYQGIVAIKIYTYWTL